MVSGADPTLAAFVDAPKSESGEAFPAMAGRSVGLC